jgi:hypothetical protein
MRIWYGRQGVIDSSTSVMDFKKRSKNERKLEATDTHYTHVSIIDRIWAREAPIYPLDEDTVWCFIKGSFKITNDVGILPRK